jgi:uncharacterized protein YehS (DUF1456 family)
LEAAREPDYLFQLKMVFPYRIYCNLVHPRNSINLAGLIVSGHLNKANASYRNKLTYKINYMLTNNDILKKLRVALNLKDEDIIDILRLVEFDISKSELGAIFRKEDHPNYKPCGDQLLRNFLNGLIIYKRGPKIEK